MATRPKTPGRVTPIEDKITAGRPRKVAPADAADVIRQACATGASKVGVAMALGCDFSVLSRWLDEDSTLQAAFAEGRETERKTLHNVLYSAAISGTDKGALIAAMFLLKARHGYQEGQQEGQANRVSVTFNIPAAQPLDQFMVIENDTGNNRTKSISTKTSRTT
jgi:hypothetical protein